MNYGGLHLHIHYASIYTKHIGCLDSYCEAYASIYTKHLGCLCSYCEDYASIYTKHLGCQVLGCLENHQFQLYVFNSLSSIFMMKLYLAWVVVLFISLPYHGGELSMTCVRFSWFCFICGVSVVSGYVLSYALSVNLMVVVSGVTHFLCGNDNQAFWKKMGVIS